MKRKLTRKDFAGLRQHYPVLSQEEMRQYVGGLNAEGYWENSDSLFATVNPYAIDFGVTPFSSSSYGYGDWDVDGGELPEVVIGGYYDGGYDAYEGYDIDGGELPEVEIGGSYPDDNENWNPEWDYYDPWPDDPDFDSTTGNDGYYDMGYWYEEYDGDNGNTGGSSGGGIIAGEENDKDEDHRGEYIMSDWACMFNCMNYLDPSKSAYNYYIQYLAEIGNDGDDPEEKGGLTSEECEDALKKCGFKYNATKDFKYEKDYQYIAIISTTMLESHAVIVKNVNTTTKDLIVFDPSKEENNVYEVRADKIPIFYRIQK